MTAKWGTTYWNTETLQYRNPHARLRLMADILRELPEKRVLDVGCSTAALKQLLPEDVEYFGVDISPKAASILPPGHFVQLDFNSDFSLDFFRASNINCVHIGGVLEYLHSPGRLLSMLRELVPEKSPMVLSIINFAAKRYDDARRHHPAWQYKPSLAELQKLLGENRWKVERVWAFDDRANWRKLGQFLMTYWLGIEHPWTMRRIKQFVMLARAA